MTKQRKAFLLAIISILFWSTMGTVFKLSLKSVNPPLLLLYASLVATLYLGASVIVNKKISLLFLSTRREVFNSALMGLFNPFLYYMILFKSYSIIPAQEAMVLNYLWPVMLVLFSMIFLKQAITLLNILAIIISFSGTYVIATHGDIIGFKFSNPLGVTLAAGSSVIWASFWILNLKDKREEETKMLLNLAFGFIYTLIWNIITGNLSLITHQGLLGATVIGIFEMGLTFVLWLTALRLSSTTAQISNLVFIAPFLSLILIHVIIGEQLLISTFIGLILIITGIFLQQYFTKRSNE